MDRTLFQMKLMARMKQGALVERDLDSLRQTTPVPAVAVST